MITWHYLWIIDCPFSLTRENRTRFWSEEKRKVIVTYDGPITYMWSDLRTLRHGLHRPNRPGDELSVT